MKNFPILLFAGIFLITACEKVVDIEIQASERTLVVEGGLLHRAEGANDLQSISLRSTVPFLAKTGTEPVTDAQVRVFDEQEVFPFVHTSDGVYTARIPTRIGQTYRLEIDIASQTIIAEETLSPVSPIDSAYASFEEETTFTDAGYFIKIDTRDQPAVRNFYHWRVYVNDSLAIVPDPGNRVNLIAEDEFFDGEQIRGYKPNEEVILEPGDLVRVEQWGISERYYDYLFQVFSQTSATPLLGNPPPARIIGNLRIPEGDGTSVLGYFSVASVATAELVVEN